mgnify:CR=1 FL=1
MENVEIIKRRKCRDVERNKQKKRYNTPVRVIYDLSSIAPVGKENNKRY